MLVVVLQCDGGVGDGEYFEAVKAGLGALRGAQVERLGRVEGAV